MRKYIRQLEKNQFTTVRGTAIPKLKTTHAQNKKLKELKTRAQKALYFSKLFGLELDCLWLKDPESSKTFTVDFNPEKSASTDTAWYTSSSNTTSTLLPDEQSQPAVHTSCQGEKQYVKLSEDDKSRVEGILHLIDKFGVGDEFIHQLSMVVGMPKPYLFKQCQKELNKDCIISTTPGKAPGAQYSFKQLLAEEVKYMVGKNIVYNITRIKRAFWLANWSFTICPWVHADDSWCAIVKEEIGITSASVKHFQRHIFLLLV